MYKKYSRILFKVPSNLDIRAQFITAAAAMMWQIMLCYEQFWLMWLCNAQYCEVYDTCAAYNICGGLGKTKISNSYMIRINIISNLYNGCNM